MDQRTINQCLKGKRTDNFTSEEKCIFIDLLVNKYKSLHEDRSQNKENNIMKRETWKALLRDFHERLGNSRRTLTQMKTLYENIKHRIKKCVDKGVFEIDWEPVNESGTFKIPIQLFEKIRLLYEQKTSSASAPAQPGDAANADADADTDALAEFQVVTDETGDREDLDEELEATALEGYPNFAVLNCPKPSGAASQWSNLKVDDNEVNLDTLGQDSIAPPKKKPKIDPILESASLPSFMQSASLPSEFLSTTEEFRRLAKVRAGAAAAELKLELQQNRQRHIAELRVLELKAKAQQAKIEYYNLLKQRLISQTD